MSEMVERVAKALFRSRYPEPEHDAFWPDRLDELVNGPPFLADGYRDLARTAIAAMREPTPGMKATDEVHWDYSCHICGGIADGWHKMIDQALAPEA